MRLFVCSDIHRTVNLGKIDSFKSIMKDELTKEDYLIVCGDFSFVWNTHEIDDPFISEIFDDFPCTVLWVDGNRENHDLLSTYPEMPWMNGQVQVIGDNVLHLKRGEVFIINGVKIFAFGGAKSLDCGHDIVINEQWWPAELPSEKEIAHAWSNLKKVDNSVDYIITHEGPPDIVYQMCSYYSQNSELFRQFLTELKEHVSFHHWYFGHHHIDQRIENYTCLYNSVQEILLA